MQERGRKVEVSKPHESLPSQQLAAAKVDFYLGLHHTFKSVAKASVGIENLPNKQRRKKIKRITNALTDLYLIKSFNLSEESFREGHPEIAETCGFLLDQHMPALQEREELYTNNASEYDRKKRMNVAFKATNRLKGLSETQRTQLFELAGYTPNQGLEITRKIGKAAVATTVLGGASTALVIAGSAYEKTSPIIGLGHMGWNKTGIAIGISEVANYAATYLNSRTNHALLKDEQVNNAPNIFAAGLYHLLQRFFPAAYIGSHRIDIPKLGTRLGTIGPVAIQEPGVIASLFTSALGPQVVFARNTIGTAINLTESVVFKRSKAMKHYLK